MSQRALARELGINQGWLSRALNGAPPLSLGFLERLADVLGVEPEHFLEYRRALAIEALERDPKLVDSVFAQVDRRALSRHRRGRPAT